MTAAVVVVAAGSGTRLGSDLPKALVQLAGRSLVAHTVAGIAAAGLPPPIVVHPPGAAAAFGAALSGLDVADLVAGGSTRTQSVRAGVRRLGSNAGVVVIHDAARPLTPPEVSRTTVAVVRGDVVAAAPGLPVADTLKRVQGTTVLGTVDRSELVAIQTPQAFQRQALEAALELGDDATDELTLLERLLDRGQLSGRIVVVQGSSLGRKVTYDDDLAFLSAIVGAYDDTGHRSMTQEAR